MLACAMKRSFSFLLQSQREKTSSMWPFHSLGLVLFVELKLFQSPPWIYLQKDTAVVVPIGTPWVWSFFHWTQMRSLLGLHQAFPLDSVWGLEDQCCETSHMLCILILFPPLVVYLCLVYTTQINSAFRARWLARSEVISQVLFTSERTNFFVRPFVGIYCHKSRDLILLHHSLAQIKLLFESSLVWQLFRLCGIYWNNYSPQCRWKWWMLPPLRWIIVK